MKYLKSLNWSGYIVVLILVGIAALANENTINFINWLFLFIIGAILGLFVLIAGRSKN